MNKILKIITIILITFVILTISPYNNTYATNATSIDEIIEAGDAFVWKGSGQSSYFDENTIKSMSDTIYKILLFIAIAVAVIIGLVIAIKFITGSVSEKAQIKETLIPYIIGCVVIFGAFTIWKIIIELMKIAMI